MRNFNEIINILKTELNIKTDGRLAQVLDIEEGNFRVMKGRGSIPFEKLIIYCNANGVSIDHLLMEDSISKVESSTQKDFRRLADQTEIAFLRDKIKTSHEKGKKAIRKARGEMEIIMGVAIKKAVQKALMKKKDKGVDPIYLSRGTIQYAGHAKRA
ncbi:MAG: hypothetical protein GQ474_01635 [Sulfurimonas sp.]|nr:hypothetical protein [Sulfurimonas sp.]